jgi:ElaB/YqjD/DUF883 family membrane-anchored ribosome-binding protein
MDDRLRAGTVDGEPLEGWVTSEARDLADAARRQQLDDPKPDATDYAAQAKEYVQGAIPHTREYAEGTLRRAHAGCDTHKLRKVKHDMTGYAREQPMNALLIAVGAGLVLGWLSATGRR